MRLRGLLFDDISPSAKTMERLLCAIGTHSAVIACHSYVFFTGGTDNMGQKGLGSGLGAPLSWRG